MAADRVMMDYVAAIAAQNDGNFERISALLTPDCTLHTAFGLIATGRDAVVDATRAAGAGSDLTTTILSSAVAGHTFTITYRHDFADGRPSMHGSGMAAFDDDGHITTLRALGESKRTVFPTS